MIRTIFWQDFLPAFPTSSGSNPASGNGHCHGPQRHVEGRAFALDAVEPDAPAMFLDDAPADRQPEPVRPGDHAALPHGHVRFPVNSWFTEYLRTAFGNTAMQDTATASA